MLRPLPQSLCLGNGPLTPKTIPNSGSASQASPSMAGTGATDVPLKSCFLHGPAPLGQLHRSLPGLCEGPSLLPTSVPMSPPCQHLYSSHLDQFSSVQFSSVAQSRPTLCDPRDRSTPGLPVHHQLPELAQTHAHRVGDVIQPSHPLSSPSPPALNLSQHQSLPQWSPLKAAWPLNHGQLQFLDSPHLPTPLPSPLGTIWTLWDPLGPPGPHSDTLAHPPSQELKNGGGGWAGGRSDPDLSQHQVCFVPTGS